MLPPHKHTHTHIFTYSHIYTHKHTHINTHTSIHTCLQAYTHMHTHTHGACILLLYCQAIFGTTRGLHEDDITYHTTRMAKKINCSFFASPAWPTTPAMHTHEKYHLHGQIPRVRPHLHDQNLFCCSTHTHLHDQTIACCPSCMII